MAANLSEWKGARPPVPGPFEGRFVRLEKLNVERHGEALWQSVAGHVSLWDYMPYGPWDVKQTFLAWLVEREALADPYYFAVIDKRTGLAAGAITLMEIRPAAGVIEVGHIFFSPGLQKTPAATEAIYLAARHAFHDLGYRRFEWKCNNGNEASKRAALRFGFQFEGLFRQHMIVKGKNRDTAWFSVIDIEWPIVERAFQTWLSPENFETNGRQKASLAAMNAREMDVGALRLNRALTGQRDEIIAFQEAAYDRNRAVLGVEPLPLKWNYDAIFAETEVWCIRDKSRLVGVLILRPREDDLYLESVATLPEMQGAGFGNKLLDATEFRARDWGYRYIRLCTGEKLTQNVDWYHRKGFSIESVENITDRNMVHMIRRLLP